MTSMIKQRCDRRLISVYRIKLAAAGVIVTSAWAAAVFLPGRTRYLLAAAFAALSAAAIVFLPPKLYERLGYVRHIDWLLIESGFVTRRTTLIPRSRIRCIALKYGFIESRFGLCTLTLWSGGNAVRLPGLTEDDAMRMKRLLERRDGYRKAG